jgi:predicted enzyme related to lactoylglutathione lyase
MLTRSMLAAAPASAVLPAADAARAKDFYERVLGLEVEAAPAPGYFFVHAGEGTTFLVYETPLKPTEATTLGFVVKDLLPVMSELRDRGVKFEEYDLPGMKTANGVADFGPMGRGAWIKDTEGNILSINQM